MPYSLVSCIVIFCMRYFFLLPGAVARSEARPLGMQAAPSSIPKSGTFFRGDLVMKTFLRPFSLFRLKKSSCQLLAKECVLSTGKLPRRLAQEQCGWGSWPRPKPPKMCWRAVKQKSNQNQTFFFCLPSLPFDVACDCGTPCIGHLSHNMTKPTKWLCAHQRLRSAWTSAQSDLSPCWALNG